MTRRKNIFGVIGAVLLSWAASGQAWADDFYISPDGNDLNPGTLAAPWRTMTKIHNMQSSLRPGDTVYFRGGDYVTTDNDRSYYSLSANGTASAPITYKNYQNEKPYIVQDSRVPNQNDWIFATIVYLSGDYITFDGISIRQSPESRAVAKHHIVKEGLRYGNAQGATVYGNYVTVRNCSITNFSASAIGVAGSNFLMEKCHLATSGHGSYITGQNGTYRFNVYDGIKGYFNQFGVQIQKVNERTPSGNRLYGNLMMNGQSAGIVLSSGVENNEIFNNIIINGGNKLTAEPGKALVPGQALAFVCYKGEVPGAGNKIFNNTFIGKSPGGLISTGECDASNGQPIGRKVEIYNNIFYPSSPVRVGMSTPNVYNNIFYNVSGSVPSGNEMVDPKLANPMGTNPLDAMLTTGSPAIDKASATVKFDYQNAARPYGMGYDIGAFEFGSPAGSGGPIVLPPGVGVPSTPLLLGPNGEVCYGGYL